MAALMGHSTHLSVPENDFDMTEDAQSDIDIDIDFETTTHPQDYENETEMHDDPGVDADEDIELRSAVEGDEYMQDEVLENADMEDFEHMAVGTSDAPELESVQDEELLDLSEDENAAEEIPTDLTIHGDDSHEVDDTATAIEVTEAYGQVHTETSHQSPPQQNEKEQVSVHDDREDVTPEAGTQVLEDGDVSSGDVEKPKDMQADATVIHGNATVETAASTIQAINEVAILADPGIVDREETASQPVLSGIETSEGVLEEQAESVDAVPADTSANSVSEPTPATITGLHPTSIQYGSSEYLLFPSGQDDDLESYLLDDENLANGSLADLLQACQIELAIRNRQNEEVWAHFEGLDMEICQDAPAAFSTSLSELLDLFVRLHNNDGRETVPAFKIQLYCKYRFPERLTLLTQLAAAGGGLSQIQLVSAYEGSGDVAEAPEEHEESGIDAGESSTLGIVGITAGSQEEDAAEHQDRSHAELSHDAKVQRELADNSTAPHVDAETATAGSPTSAAVASEASSKTLSPEPEAVVDTTTVAEYENSRQDANAISASSQPATEPTIPEGGNKLLDLQTDVKAAKPTKNVTNDTGAAANGGPDHETLAAASDGKEHFDDSATDDGLDEIDFDDDDTEPPAESSTEITVGRHAAEVNSGTAQKRAIDLDDDSDDSDVKRRRPAEAST